MPDFKGNFPKWRPTDLREQLKGLDNDGISLMEAMLQYPPMDRVTAKQALSHRFLRDLSFKLPPVPSLYPSTNDNENQ